MSCGLWAVGITKGSGASPVGWGNQTITGNQVFYASNPISRAAYLRKRKEAITPVARTATDNRQLEQVQSNVINSINSIIDSQAGRQLLIEGIDLQAGVQKVVPHRLGRSIKGYTIVRSDTQGVALSENITDNKQLDKQILLTSNVDCMISLWVF